MTRRNALSRFAVLVIPISLFTLSCFSVAPAFADDLGLSGCGASTAVSTTSGSANVNCSVNFNPDPANIQTGTVTETGNLATGTSGIMVNVTNTPIVTPGGGSVSASLDAVYVFNGLGVSSGIAEFDLTASGSFSSSGGNGQMEFEYSEGALTVNGVLVSNTNVAFLGSGSSVIVLDAPIVNGTVDLRFTEVAIANCPSLGFPLTGCTSTTDFLDPFSITGARAFDANLNPVSASFVSESGFNPNAGTGMQTPEPSSLMLLAAGALGLFGPIRRKFLR